MEIAPMNTQVLDARRDADGGYRVDVSRGERVGRVSSEWFSRPADQRYLSLNEHTFQSRVAPQGRNFCYPQNHAGGRADQAWRTERALARQLGGTA